MTLGERLRSATRALEAVTDTPRLDAEILLAHALGISRAKLLAELREAHDPADFDALLARRMNHEPIAYILGEWEFFSLRFHCRAPILVPRPETEHLVETALDFLRKPVGDRTRILDLCTGSGCVAVVLARHCPDAQVWAVDINPAAVALARENVARHASRVQVLEGDLFAPLPRDVAPLDVIVANPPYVADGEWETLPQVIRRHEDPVALLSGADGLDCVRRIVDEARGWLRPGGLLAMEIAETQGDAASALLEAHGYAEVSVLSDLAGQDRIVRGLRS